MKKLMTCAVFALIIGLMASVPVDARSSKPKQQVVPPSTKVTDIDAASFTFKTSNGKQVNSYVINGFTKVIVNGNPAKFEDVKKGMKVSVISSDGKVASRIDADGTGEEPKDDKKKDPKKK